MILAILDTETGGLDPKKDPLLEVAVCLWSVEHRAITGCWSAIVASETNDAEAINHIPAAMLPNGAPYERVCERLRKYASASDVVVAHNAAFDQGFLPDLGRPWVCSKTDIKWPNSEQGAKLVVTALDHGVAVAHAHRAIDDVLTLARLFERVAEKHDIKALIARGMRPKAEFLSLAPFEQKDVVKENGFKWFAKERQWRRTMAIEDAKGLPFMVSRIS